MIATSNFIILHGKKFRKISEHQFEINVQILHANILILHLDKVCILSIIMDVSMFGLGQWV